MFDGLVEGSDTIIVAIHLQPRNQRCQLLIATGMVPERGDGGGGERGRGGRRGEGERGRRGEGEREGDYTVYC